MTETGQMQVPPQAAFLDRLTEKMEQTFGVRAVFGAPVERDGTLVVPVARARWGIGGGAGAMSARLGSAGGGGAVVHPVGFIELRDGNVKYRPIVSGQLIVVAGTLLAISAMKTLSFLRWMAAPRRLEVFGLKRRQPWFRLRSR